MPQKILLLLAGMLIGCAAAAGISSVNAQGTTPTRTGMETGQFSECFASSIYHVSGRDLNRGEMPRQTVRIPRGWTPVGGGVGGGGSSSTVVVLCR
jgi:hypothetical protein